MNVCVYFFFFSSRRRHTRCALVTGVQTCALPISLRARQSLARWPFEQEIANRAPTGQLATMTKAIAKTLKLDSSYQIPDSISLNQLTDIMVKSRYENPDRSEEHTSELQSLMRISYAVFCSKKKHQKHNKTITLLDRNRTKLTMIKN